VGALLPASITGTIPATARPGGGAVFVVEADEYAGNFDAYRPAIAVVTNIEWDHPDVFADRAAVIDAFEGWLRRAGAQPDRARPWTAGEATPPVAPRGVPALVANLSDPGVQALLDRLADWQGPIVLTALLEADGDPAALPFEQLLRTAQSPGLRRILVARIIESDPRGTTMELLGLQPAAFDPDAPAVEVRLPTAGRHNVANALTVAGAAILVGVMPQQIVDGLASFEGIGRRLERKGEARGVVVYDDYGHHPTAIRETMAAVRQLEPGRRLWAVYEPLTFHRTAALLDDFAEVLALADGVAIADIWAGRDTDRTITSSTALADAIRRRREDLVAAPGSVEATAEWLAGQVRPGDAVLVMGGGHSYRIGEQLLVALERQAAGFSPAD
jgi:UDP-N-acetylmuramate--alanine ligase